MVVTLGLPAAAVAGPTRDWTAGVRAHAGGHPRLASSLRDDLEAGGPVSAAVTAGATPSAPAAESVTVVVEASDTAAASSAVESVGGVVNESLTGLVQADVPANQLAVLADARGVRHVREPYVAVPAVESEGVASIGADAWQDDGRTGLGVKVAIVDGGFVGYAGKLGTELPASVETDFTRCGGTANGTDHGTAVAEIVHDVAPNASLFLVCIVTDVDFVSATATLNAAGVKVVNASIGWTQTGRGDGSGGTNTPAGAVASLRRQGILYVGAAGNSGATHYNVLGVGDNEQGTSLADLVDISPDDRLTFALAGGETGAVTLRWDAWPTTHLDFDVYVGNDLCPFIGAGDDDQSTNGGEPVEFAPFTNCSGSTQIFEVIVNRYSGTGTPRLDIFLDGFVGSLEHTSGGGIVEPATSPAVLAVGAFCHLDGQAESYSSRGPTIDDRVKPDISGPDGTSSSVYGSSQPSCQGGFTGTSAATPHVAGAAALVREVNPGLDVAELQQLLEDSTVDAGAAGRDSVYGAGRLLLGDPAASRPPPAQPYTPVAPLRLFDSRPGALGAAEAAFGPSGRTTPLPSGGEIALQVREIAGVPADATAVVLNVTVTEPTAGGFLTLYPGGVRPNTSNLNFIPGQTVAGSVTATVAANDRIRIFNSFGTTHVIVDLTGWYGPTSTSGPATNRFTPLANPARAIDTRPGTLGYAEAAFGPSGWTTPVAGGAEIVVEVAGLGGVPADATGVILNVTVTEPTGGGFLTLYPNGVSRPSTSSINFVPGQTVANLVVSAVGSGGKVRLFNSFGQTHMIVDTIGWFRSGSGAGYVALDPPRRDLDTRSGNGPRLGALAGGATFELQVGHYYGVPGDAAAVVLNVIAVQPTASGFLTIFPAGQSRPSSSNLNFTPGAVVPNAVVAGLGSNDKVAFFNSFGITHVVSDLSGYFIDPALQPVPPA